MLTLQNEFFSECAQWYMPAAPEAERLWCVADKLWYLTVFCTSNHTNCHSWNSISQAGIKSTGPWFRDFVLSSSSSWTKHNFEKSISFSTAFLRACIQFEVSYVSKKSGWNWKKTQKKQPIIQTNKHAFQDLQNQFPKQAFNFNILIGIHNKKEKANIFPKLNYM